MKENQSNSILKAALLLIGNRLADRFFGWLSLLAISFSIAVSDTCSCISVQSQAVNSTAVQITSWGSWLIQFLLGTMSKYLKFFGLGKVPLCMAWLASLVVAQLRLSRQNQVVAHLITPMEHVCPAQAAWVVLADCQQKLSFENTD